MPFIGKQPQAGAYSKLDAITTSATATYNLTLDSGAYYPQSANHLLVSLNGVIQAPQDSFTVSGSQIIFDSALTSADVIDFIIALGDTLDIGVPSAGSVNTSQLANDAVTSAKLDTNIDIAGTLDVTSTTTLDSTLAVAGHSSIGNAGTVAGTRALTVVGATDGTGSSIIVGYNSSLSSKFSVRDDGYTTIGAGMNVQGNITLASSAGIDFSGNANASGMTSELLDYYEEGSWAPIFTDGVGGTVTSINYHSKYTVIGNLVYLNFYVGRDDARSLTSQFNITNLPFISVSGSAQNCGSVWIDNNAISDQRQFLYVGSSSTTAIFTIVGSSSTFLTTNQWENGRYMYGSLTYRTA